MYKKLNLADITASDIKYTISKFPDGQQTVDIEWSGNIDTIIIDSRMNSFRDVELIVCANQALKNNGAKNVGLHVPYFLGARSDRKFRQGGSNYLKQVICPIINSQNFFTVIVLDPHSDVLEACLNNYEKIDNHLLVKQALTLIDNKNDARERICLVSPDAGAYKKVFDVAKKFDINKVITATKVRDLKTGQILRTEIPTLDQHNNLKYVIVDDICDGGRTFIELAKAIKGSRPTAELYLVVTHGIFSSGYVELGKYFNGIYCTNSVKDIVNDPEDTDIEREMKAKVKQLNVF